MVKYICEKCGKEFQQKGNYIKHLERKYPCMIKKVIEEKGMESSDKEEKEELKVEMGVNSKVNSEQKVIYKKKKVKDNSEKTKLESVSSLSMNNDETVYDISDLINKVSYGECIEKMKRIPENSIDMVCTDPPYFLDGLGNDWNKEAIDHKGSSAVVGNLPKGMKFDRNQSKKFNEFYMKVSFEIFRILKPGGVFISFSSARLYHSMTMAIEEVGFEIRDMLGWIYTQSQVKAFSQDHIIEKDKSLTVEQKEELKRKCNGWKTPQLKPAIEPMCLAVKPIEGRYIDNFEKYGVGLMNTSEETKTGEGFFPSNIITTDHIEESMDRVFLVSKPNKKEKGEYNTHLSVKPVCLISHLIKLFTKENAIVLDPFMGSGTTAIACIETKRRYMGFDINKEYIKITDRRIEDFISQTSV
jgi:site-specific DNA-methyltransferase (adenine-specific)